MNVTACKQVPAWQTSDARTWFDRDEAMAHERSLHAGARAGEYVATLDIQNKRHRTRMENIIAKYIEWDASSKGADNNEGN